jgi:hypothetical protein
MKNECRFLNVWMAHYDQSFDSEDIYILDHDSTDTAVMMMYERWRCDCNIIPVHRYYSFDHNWLKQTVEDFQKFLLQSYDVVLFTEADEILVPDPDKFHGLGDYLEAMDKDSGWRVIRAIGHEVVHNKRAGEADLNWGHYPLLGQRNWWAPSVLYSKPTVVRVPLNYHLGFHDAFNCPFISADMPELHLLHLHRIDYNYCRDKHRANLKLEWSKWDLEAGAGFHNRIVDDTDFENWFYNPRYENQKLEVIPEKWKSAI